MTTSTRTGEKMVPVLYCDIDGTIRWGKDELGRFVNTAEDVRVFDGVGLLLWAYKKLGWRIVGISNQGGIALGHMDMNTCVAAMAETQRQTGFAFDKIAWCSHHPDAEDPEMAVCWCRKPKAGLVIEAAWMLTEQHDEIYPPHLGLFVGDRPEDKACAENAGLKFLDAAEWRTGKHLELLKTWTMEQVAEKLTPKLTSDEVRTALGMDSLKTEEPLSEDVIEKSLEITGVKTKTVPVCDLDVGADFVYNGVLYTVDSKSELRLIAVFEGGTEIMFYDNTMLESSQMATDSVPWFVDVLTDA